MMNAKAKPETPALEGLTFKRASASGRKGATRWEVYEGTELSTETWLGDLVRFLPEHEWVWQPKETFGAVMRGKPLPDYSRRSLAEALSVLRDWVSYLKPPQVDPNDPRWVGYEEMLRSFGQHFVSERVAERKSADPVVRLGRWEDFTGFLESEGHLREGDVTVADWAAYWEAADRLGLVER